MGTTKAELTKQGQLKLLGNVNTRLPVITDGLVAHFPFDNTIIGENTGNLYIDNSIWDTDRMVVGATYPINDDGTSHDTLMLEAMVYITAVPSERFTVIETRRTNTGLNVYLSIDSNMKVNVYDHNKANNGYHVSNQKLELNRWYKIAHLETLTETFIIIDGIVDTRFNNAYDGATTLFGDMYIGAESAGRHFQGMITGIAVGTCDPYDAVQDNNIITANGVNVERSVTNLLVTNGWTTHGVKDPIDMPAHFPGGKIYISSKTDGLADWDDMAYYGTAFVLADLESVTISGWFYSKENGGAFNCQIGKTGNPNYGVPPYNGVSTGLPKGWHYFIWTYQNTTGANETVNNIRIENYNRVTWPSGSNAAWGANYQIEIRDYSTRFANGTRPTANGVTLSNPVRTGNFTVNFKAKINTIPGAVVTYQALFSMGAYYTNNSFTIMDRGGTTVQGNQRIIRKGNLAEWNWGPANFTFDSTFNNVNMITVVRNATNYRCFTNGAFIGEFAHASTTMGDTIWVGSKNDTSSIGSSTIKDLSIYNRALSDEEVGELFNNCFDLKTSGDLVIPGLISRPQIPDNVHLFPLDFDAKDEYKTYTPTIETNTIFEDGTLFIGEGTTNILAPLAYLTAPSTELNGYTGWYSLGIANDNPRVTIYTENTAVLPSTMHTFSAIYWSSTGVVDDVYLRFVGTGYPEGGAFIQPFRQSHSSQLGGYSVITDLGNNWKHCYGTFQTTADTTALDAVFFDADTAGLEVFITNLQLEAKPYPSPYTEVTTGNAELEYSFPDILTSTDDWTVGVFAKGNKYSIDSGAERFSVISVGDYYDPNESDVAWGRWNVTARVWNLLGYNNLVGKTTGIVTLSAEDAYGWNLFVIKYDNAADIVYGRIVSESGTMYSTLSTSRPLTGIQPVVQLGGYDWDADNWDGYLKDFFIIDRQLTDDEINDIAKNKMEQFLDNLGVQSNIETGIDLG